ncbi:HEAT repeat domain-containing protein, partial [Planctomycetota bacterium]
ESPAVNPAIVAMIDVTPKKEDLYDEEGKDAWVEWFRYGSRRTERMRDWYNEYRSDAVRACGERRIEEARDKLRELAKEEWDHLKFQAQISLVELGDKKALGSLRWYLPRYDDRFYRDVDAIMGKTKVYTKRMSWSSIFDVCDKFERVGDAELYLPLLDELLQTEKKNKDPMAPGWAKRHGGDEDDSATVMREASEEEHPLFRPPEVSYRLRNQFARRRIVECAAKLGGAEAAPQLGRALRDSRATVRAAALRAVGEISELYDLPRGADIAAERGVWPKATGWLKGKGAWPD